MSGKSRSEATRSRNLPFRGMSSRVRLSPSNPHLSRIDSCVNPGCVTRCFGSPPVGRPTACRVRPIHPRAVELGCVWRPSSRAEGSFVCLAQSNGLGTRVQKAAEGQRPGNLALPSDISVFDIPNATCETAHGEGSGEQARSRAVGPAVE